MSDLGELIRDYYESVADPVTVEEIVYGAIGEGPVRPLGTPPVRRRRRFRGRLRVHELPPFDAQRRDKLTDSKIDQPTPGSRGPRVRRGLAIGAAAAALAIIVGVVAFMFVADDDTDVAGSGEVEIGPITSFDDIAGTTYERQGVVPPRYFHFFEDGTLHHSSNRDLVEERPSVIQETSFEGTTVFLHEIAGLCSDDPDAIYEIHLLENGNLQFVAIEDACPPRSTNFPAEYTPLP